MMMGSARGFSTTIDTDDSDLEEPASTSSETQKGRFFKFLEKAEELDDKIKVNPTEAKKVTSEADSEALEEPAIMFDANEIEISFADKVTERELSEELKELESATKEEAVAVKDVKSPSKQQEELM